MNQSTMMASDIYPHECVYPLGSFISPFQGPFSSPFPSYVQSKIPLRSIHSLFTFAITIDGVYPSDIPLVFNFLAL